MSDKAKPIKLKVCNEKVKDNAKSQIDALPFEPLSEVIIRRYKKNRSDIQNSLQHVHYAQIAKQMGETPVETKSRCKLDFGLPIMQAAENQDDFMRRWNKYYAQYNREAQIELMRDVKLTSLFTVRQACEYIKAYMFEHESNDIYLSHPQDMWIEAMGKSK